MLKQELTVTIYTENNIGLLNRVTTMFSRRRINIESLNVAASEAEGIHRFTIVVFDIEDVIKKLCLQIEKQVDIFKCFCHTDKEIVWHEQALYKVAKNAATYADFEKLLLLHGGKRLNGTNDDYTIFEITGMSEATIALAKKLGQLGLAEFVKGGRIAVAKAGNDFHQKLKLASMHKKPEENNLLSNIENDLLRY